MDPQRILVRAPNWIGDQVMAISFYRALHRLFPKAELSLLGVPAVLGVELGLPVARRLAVSRDRSPFAIWRAGRALSVHHFDVAITLTASLSSALLLRASGIPLRIGFAEPSARWLLTDAVPWRGRASGRHKAQLYCDLISRLGGPGTSPVFPEVAPTAPAKRIVLAPGASIALREWPYFAELTRALRARYPEHEILVVGSNADRGWEKLVREGAESRIGRTTLGELQALCAPAAVVVANDSGVAHVAASLAGAPTVVLFGPGDPEYIRPLGPRVLEARASGVPCSPCESARCRAAYGYQKCLRDLSVETVLARVAEVVPVL